VRSGCCGGGGGLGRGGWVMGSFGGWVRLRRRRMRGWRKSELGLCETFCCGVRILRIEV